MSVYAKVNRRNDEVELYPVSQQNLNRSCSAVAGTGITVPEDATDETLIQYLHVRVRFEDKPSTPAGGSVEALALDKEPDGHWWERYQTNDPSAGRLAALRISTKAMVDSSLAWNERMKDADLDDGADMKARIDAAETYEEIVAIGNELNAP